MPRPSQQHRAKHMLQSGNNSLERTQLARSGSYGDFEFQDHRHRTCSVTRWSGPRLSRQLHIKPALIRAGFFVYDESGAAQLAAVRQATRSDPMAKQ